MSIQVVTRINGKFNNDILVEKSSINATIHMYMGSSVTEIDTHVRNGECRIYRRIWNGRGPWVTASGKDIVEATANLLDFPHRQLVSFNENIIGREPTGHILRWALVSNGKLIV